MNVTLTLLNGLGTTVQIFLLTLLFALPLGLVIAFGSMSKVAPLRWVCNLLVWVVGHPADAPAHRVHVHPRDLGAQHLGRRRRGPDDRHRGGLLHQLRLLLLRDLPGGIQGVPLGQREAAQVLGMTKRQIFFKVTLLQMIKRIVPPMSNEIITLVKDTSLARIIAVYELTFTGYSYMKSSGLVWPLLYTGVFYLLFVGILTLLFNFIERKLSYFR